MAKKKKTNTSEVDALPADLVGAGEATAVGALERAGENAERLVAAWIEAKNVRAVLVASERAKGTARKAARRGLNVLKSRGVAIPDRKRVAKVEIDREEALEAWMMAPDAGGNVLFVLGARARAGRYRTCFVFLHDEVGVVRVQVGVMSRSQLKEAFSKILPGAAYRPVNVPVEYARWRVHAARERNRERDIPEPLGLETAGDLVAPAPSKPPTHPFDAEGLVVSDDDVKDRAARSAQLHALPEFRAWIPPKPAVDEMMIKVGEGLTAGVEPDPEIVEERVKEQVEAATDRFFTPDRRQALVAAMKDSAYSVYTREGEQPALDVAATMTAVDRAGLITDPPREIPFLKAFFEKALSVLVARGEGSLRIPVPAVPTQGDTASSIASADSEA